MYIEKALACETIFRLELNVIKAIAIFFILSDDLITLLLDY